MRPTLARNNSHHSHAANAPKNFRNRSGGVLKRFRSYKRVSTFLAAFVVAATLIASLVVWRVQAHRSDAQAAIKTASTQSKASLPMDWQRAKRSAFARILAPDPFAAPSILTSVSSLPDFGSVNVGSASAEQTYTVSGSNLTADITVTAPSTDFEVSETTGTGFGSSVTFTQSGGSVPTLTVFVRFTPQSTGPKSGDVTNESTGATTQNVAVSGTGDPVPPPSTSVVSLNLTSGSPTNQLTADWQIVFADAVDGLTATNFAVVNTGLGGSPAVESVGNPSGILPSTTWNITVTTGTGEGTLGLDMVNDTGVTHDVTNLPFTGEVYTVDQVAPSTTSFTRQDPNPTNADTLVFRATFSEDVTLVDTTDFAVMGTTTATPTSVDPVSTSVYDVTVSGGDLAGFNGDVGLDFSVALDITDIAGNALPNTEPATDETYTLQQIPASLVVNTTADADDGFCTTDENGCTLREAINAANSDPDTNTITFEIPSPGPDVIFLELGQLQITESVDINGPTAKSTTVDGNNGTRIFAVFAGTVSISNLTIANADAGGGGGGGIRNAASLTLSNVTISANSARGGGGIANSGTLNVTNSTISGNSAGTDGGGIYNTGGGTLSLLNVTITNNTADQDEDGSRDGGGVFNANGSTGAFTARNSIIAGNIDIGGEAPDVAGNLDSLGHNLIGSGDGSSGLTDDPTCATLCDKVGTNASPRNALLGALINNGGPTFTHGLLYNSPAVDAGDDCVFTNTCVPSLGAALTTDQRGALFPRQADGDLVVGPHVDIGAYERQATETRDVSNGANSQVDLVDVKLTFPCVPALDCSVVKANREGAQRETNIITPNGAPAASITVIDPNAQGPIPGGYSVGTAPTPAGCASNPSQAQCLPAFDVSTTASYTGPVGICFYLPTITDQSFFGRLKILHNGGSGLVDVTTGQNFGAKIVCGSVTTLSPFVIAEGLTPTAANGNVSGHIADSNGNPVEGVGVRMTGTQNRLTVTDAAGNYRFDNVEANGFYTVVPARANFAFSPSQRAFSQLGQHTDAAFNATGTGGGLNPLDATEYFVRQQYVDFLGREPDEAGFNFWVNNIESCGANAQCRDNARINTSAAFFLSIEFQQTGYLVYRTYQAAYGDLTGAPVPLRLNEFKPDTSAISNGLVVLKSGWETVLENNKRAYAAEFVQRGRFTAAYPMTMTPDQFVDLLFTNAGVTPAASARAAAIGEFGAAATSADLAARARALRRVAENSTLAQQEFNQAFVLMQYFGYLGRDANTGPDTDFSGYNFWLDKLNSFNGNFQNAEMVRAFLVAGEYRGRFPR